MHYGGAYGLHFLTRRNNLIKWTFLKINVLDEFLIVHGIPSQCDFIGVSVGPNLLQVIAAIPGVSSLELSNSIRIAPQFDVVAIGCLLSPRALKRPW